MILRAISLMILAMALLAGSDVFFKLSTALAPAGQVMTLVSLGGTAAFVALAGAMGAPVFGRDALHPLVMLRNGLEILAAIGLLYALKYVPLPIFAAIMQGGPLVVVLGAAIFLKEQVGWRRWTAVGVGILGMLLVIRPFGTGFTGHEFWAILGVVSLAARDLVTRLSPPHIPSLAISTRGFAATIPVGLVIWSMEGLPPQLEAPALWAIAGAILFTTTGYLAITTAMRLAPASVVSPFRYARLVFTTGLGILIFGDRPDAMTLLGAAIILCAGLYTFLRERRLAREGETGA
ncbi:DMT family transporter [Ponticoccus litoralis]|uniref:DMT family transporter n=1 Tax=Ponticoccus litoralis TaxID=422297 RepID=A0AAW9SCM8_9RHOB